MAELKGFPCNVRLACQTRLQGPITLRRLILDDCDEKLADVDTPHSTVREETVAVLFSDIRGFTAFAESHLPYDVVHILNRYFYHMGEAVLRHGGVIDKYMGDGIMALFGLDKHDPAAACEQAVRSSLDMLTALGELNGYLSRFFEATLDIGIGIHVGEVIVGEIGHPSLMQFTAIGDTVNIASRIESATKEFGVRLLVSEAVRRQLEGKAAFGKEASTLLRGVTETMRLYELVELLT